MTYESSEEAKVLEKLWRPGQPLENTVFTILDPRGRQLIRSERSPERVFKDSAALSAFMNRVANSFRGIGEPRSLPIVDGVPLGLNVAACDRRPLVVVVGENNQVRNILEARMASTAWSDANIGKLIYTTGKQQDLSAIRGTRIGRGYLFVIPNEFGTTGTVLCQLSASASAPELEKAARQAIAYGVPEKLPSRAHVQAGYRAGAQWQSAIPITDPHSIEARRGGYGGVTNAGGTTRSRQQYIKNY